MSISPSKIIKDISCILDSSLQKKVLRNKILEFTDEDVFNFIQEMINTIENEESRAVYLSFLQAFFSEEAIPYSRKESLYKTFLENMGNYAKIFLNIPPMKQCSLSDLDSELSDIPLGVRKAKARLHNRDILLRLLFDPDPCVIEILLENPKICEEDVVRIASRRPQRKEIFWRILANRRFFVRLKVIEAMALNPYAPTALSISLLPLISKKTIFEISEDETLHPFLRQFSSELIEKSKKKIYF